MSSSSQLGLKRLKKSGSQNRKDLKKRKKEEKVLASSMKSYLFGGSSREHRAEDQEIAVNERRDNEYHGSSEKSEIESLDETLDRDLCELNFSLQERHSDCQTGLGEESEWEVKLKEAGEKKQENKNKRDQEDEKKEEEEKEKKQKDEQKNQAEAEKKQNEDKESEGKECFTEKKEGTGSSYSMTCIGVCVDSDEVRTFDPSSIICKNLSAEEKYVILEMEPCQPSMSYLSQRKKLCKSTMRCCSQNVFYHDGKLQNRRKWISYSKSKDALFCIPCLLFTDSSSRGENQRLNQGNAFTVTGFANWNKQYTTVPNHEKTAIHQEAVISQALFLQEKTLKELFQKHDETSRARKTRKVEANRNILKRIVDTIFLLGKQGLAFRGHREILIDDFTNTGNFLETLKYLSEYDLVLNTHLEKVKAGQQEKHAGAKDGKVGRGKKLTFLSMNTQNKIIDIIGKEIAAEISSMIRDCRAWALIADTTPDVTKHEQLSVCVRIVSKDGKVSEHLLFCTRASATTAKALYETISSGLEAKGVSYENLVAQTYDGASNMSGEYNGLQALIKEHIGEHVIFIHCYAHTLNLVLSDTASVSIHVSKLFDDLEKLYNMFRKSQPIHEMFELKQREMGLDVLSIKRINTVRWNSREFSLRAFIDRYDSVSSVLEEISGNISFKSETRSTATGLLDAFRTKQFISTAYLFREIFATTGPLSRQLQAIEIDFSKALRLIEGAMQQMRQLRENPHGLIEVVERDFNPEEYPWKERRVRKTKRMVGEVAEDEPAATAEDAWLREAFYISIDCVIQGLKNRFSGKSRIILNAFSLLSPSRFAEFENKHLTAAHLQVEIERFCELYGIDSFKCANELFSFAKVFPKFNTDILKSHSDKENNSDNWNRSDDEEDCLTDTDVNGNQNTILDCLAILSHPRYNLIDAYPILCKVYSISVAIPVTSASSERTFSVLKRVKSRIRSSMIQERLEALLLMAIERKVLLSLDKDRIVDIFGRSSSELTNALF